MKNIKCQNCGYEWEYKGKSKYYCTCPRCLYKVSIGNKRYGLGVCEMCKKHFELIHIHHIIPIKEGGTNNRKNLMQLCSSCHRKIHNSEVIKNDV